MVDSRALRWLVVALALLSLAYSLTCKQASCTPLPVHMTCAPPLDMNCSEEYTPGFGFPDRCLTMIALTANGTFEARYCSYSMMQCASPELVCTPLSNAYPLQSCGVHCCDSDNCNAGPMPTGGPKWPPEQTGPSGSNLSCYHCENNVMEGMSTVSCDAGPVTQTCGIQDGMFGLNQDRCLLMKGKVIVDGTEKEFEMRNCTSSANCKMDLCRIVMGNPGNDTITKCNATCCTGNLCNVPVPSADPTDSAANRFESGLVALITILLLLTFLAHI